MSWDQNNNSRLVIQFARVLQEPAADERGKKGAPFFIWIGLWLSEVKKSSQPVDHNNVTPAAPSYSNNSWLANLAWKICMKEEKHTCDSPYLLLSVWVCCAVRRRRRARGHCADRTFVCGSHCLTHERQKNSTGELGLCWTYCRNHDMALLAFFFINAIIFYEGSTF